MSRDHQPATCSIAIHSQYYMKNSSCFPLTIFWPVAQKIFFESTDITLWISQVSTHI